MKRLLIFLMALLTAKAQATDYYLSNLGNDGNNGTSTSTPWATIGKLNGQTLAAGDRVFFRRGDTFYGTVNTTGNGTNANRIIYDAYGSGALPIITGFTTLSQNNADWTQVSTNVWELNAAVSGGLTANLNVVTLNGGVKPMGRYPNMTVTNGSYILYQSHIVDSVIFTADGNYPALNPAVTGINWVGAQIVVKSTDYTIDTAQILTHSYSGGSARLSFSSDKIYTTGVQTTILLNNFGFFIQNDPRTLDQHGEWYYNKTTKKFRIYLTTAPSNYTIKVPTLVNGLTITGDDYLTFQNIRFEGFNENAVYIDGASVNKQFIGVEFQYARSAIWVGDGSSTHTHVENCTLTDITGIGIYHRNTPNITVRGCTMDRIGVWPGLGAINFSGYGVWCDQGEISYARNTIREVGYIPLRGEKNNISIDSNYIDGAQRTHMDGAAIYIGNNNAMYTNRKIRYNVILNSFGNNYGTSSQGNKNKNGGAIYLDDFAHDVEIAHNVVGLNKMTSMYFHNVRNINVHDNLIYGGYQYVVYWSTHATGVANTDPATFPAYRVWGTKFQNNTIIAREDTTFVMRVKHNVIDSGYIRLFDEANGAAPGTNVNDNFNDNVYARPVNQDSITFVLSYSPTSGAKYRTNTMWKNNFLHDSRTIGTPKQFQSWSNIDTVFTFYYNTEAADTTFTLSRTLMDMQGQVHFSGENVTLPGYSGIVYLAHTAAGAPPPSGDPGTISSYHLYKHASGRLYRNARTGKLLARSLGYVQQNLFTRSEEIDHVDWVKPTGITITANNTTAPDATSTAEKVVETDAVTSQKNVKQTVSVTIDTTYTLSGYFKAAGRNYVQLAMSTAGSAFTTNAFANFSFVSGTITLQGSALLDAKMESIGNGWYRCSITAKALASTASSTPQFTPVPTSTSGRLPSYAGVAGSDIYAWGLQMNTGLLKPYTKTVATNIP